MLRKSVSIVAVSVLLAIGRLPPVLAQVEKHASAPSETRASAASVRIPPGTTITIANWQKYKSFMPEGMIALFNGTYYWRMPSDVQMEIGPTVLHPLPKTYVKATENYASQVKVIELAGGRLSLEGYQGGVPFPNPAEPHRGWKILTNLWYRYIPHLLVDTYGTGCYVDSVSGISCNADEIVYRQLSFNTDPGVPVNFSGAEGKFYSQFAMTLEPEQQKYHASLTISYNNPGKPEDAYIFNPVIRRHQTLSASARCAPSPAATRLPTMHDSVSTPT